MRVAELLEEATAQLSTAKGVSRMSDIEYRKLGGSGIEVPALGVGTQAWGDQRWGFGKSYNSDDLFQAYQASIAAGLNYFDT